MVAGANGVSRRIDLTEAEIDECVAQEEAWAAGAAARAFASLRDQRDRLLAETDWMALPDSPAMSDGWTKYRADLRALPAQYDNSSILGTITFPTPPS
jgi:hypothetical protein